MDRDKRVDELLEIECGLVDVLPEQVPEESGGAWFAVEERLRGLMEAQAGTLDLYFPEEDALILLNGDDLYMTVFHPSADMLRKMGPLASSEGLSWRKNP